MTDDAWKQQADLKRLYTNEFKVRADLEVTALGTERCVRLTMYGAKDKFGKRPLLSTDRNVSTMRELADAIYSACAFVEASNPDWAEKGKTLDIKGITFTEPESE